VTDQSVALFESGHFEVGSGLIQESCFAWDLQEAGQTAMAALAYYQTLMVGSTS